MADQHELEQIIDQLKETNKIAREQLQRITVGGAANVKIGSTFAQGAFVGMCIATCVATWIALILFAMDVHDLRAWKDVHQRRIDLIEAQQKRGN